MLKLPLVMPSESTLFRERMGIHIGVSGVTFFDDFPVQYLDAE